MSGNSKIIPLVLILLLPVIGYTVYSLLPTATNQGFSPEQPIPYSHKLHAGTLKIQCQYCHSNAEKSYHAGVPALNVCMNCHSVVKTESPHIQKIKAAYDSGKPFEWVRVHELPDHARFPHKRHIAKGVACQTCHGKVEDMEKVYQYAPLTMGWCIDCHRGETTPDNVLAKVFPGDKSPHGKKVASVECSACHY